MITELSDENFAEYVGKGLKPVWFTAPWCGYCVRQKAILDEMKEIQIGLINSEKAPIETYKFNVTAYPTLIIFKDGKEINRYLGLKDKFEIMNILTKYVK